MKRVANLVVLLVLAFAALQLFFVGRVALAVWVAPESTAFQRSEAWRLASTGGLRWRQEWVAYSRIADSLKRAVIASEDAAFAQHEGVDWDALEKAWEKNQRAEQRAAQAAQRSRPPGVTVSPGVIAKSPPIKAPKVVGGSTITQQLAKNLLLSGERNFLRKGQELLLTFALEALLDKRRILEIYLNSVEWGEGVFGVQAAAMHYFNLPASQLSAYQAARLAVMLPAPKRFERRANSGYLTDRANVIVGRMSAVELP